MQRAVSSNPPTMFLSISPYSPPVTVIEYGAIAALFNCGITAGVECRRVHISPLFQIILSVIKLFPGFTGGVMTYATVSDNLPSHQCPSNQSGCNSYATSG